MSDGLSPWVDTSWGDGLGDAVDGDADLPLIPQAVFRGFDQRMVLRAQQTAIPQAGGATGPPGNVVMRVTHNRRRVAVGEDTSAVPQGQRGADRRGDQPARATHIQDLPGGAQHGGDQVCRCRVNTDPVAPSEC